MNNIGFAPKEPAALNAEDIAIDGVVYGDVRLTPLPSMPGYYRFHACLWFSEGMNDLGHGFIQGFAETKRGAILNALKNGRHDALTLLSEIECFEDLASGPPF